MLSIKSSEVLSPGHAGIPNLEILRKAKVLPFSVLELSTDLITFDCDFRLST